MALTHKIPKPELSTHEKTQQALRRQIAELEQQVIGPKDWTLMGEASAKSRPENSLLEEDLDFEQVGKVVPVVTEESVKTLEDMIKIRIRDVSGFSPSPSWNVSCVFFPGCKCATCDSTRSSSLPYLPTIHGFSVETKH